MLAQGISANNVTKTRDRMNGPSRAKMARIMAIRLRVLAAATKAVSAEALEQAAAVAAERDYMQFSNE